jgi:hypothetical protein
VGAGLGGTVGSAVGLGVVVGAGDEHAATINDTAATTTLHDTA